MPRLRFKLKMKFRINDHWSECMDAIRNRKNTIITTIFQPKYKTWKERKDELYSYIKSLKELSGYDIAPQDFEDDKIEIIFHKEEIPYVGTRDQLVAIQILRAMLYSKRLAWRVLNLRKEYKYLTSWDIFFIAQQQLAKENKLPKKWDIYWDCLPEYEVKYYSLNTIKKLLGDPEKVTYRRTINALFESLSTNESYGLYNIGKKVKKLSYYFKSNQSKFIERYEDRIS